MKSIYCIHFFKFSAFIGCFRWAEEWSVSSPNTAGSALTSTMYRKIFRQESGYFSAPLYLTAIKKIIYMQKALQ